MAKVRQMEEYQVDLFPAHKMSDSVALTCFLSQPYPSGKG